MVTLVAAHLCVGLWLFAAIVGERSLLVAFGGGRRLRAKVYVTSSGHVVRCGLSGVAARFTLAADITLTIRA